jgi:hypothetical protein
MAVDEGILDTVEGLRDPEPAGSGGEKGRLGVTPSWVSTGVPQAGQKRALSGTSEGQRAHAAMVRRCYHPARRPTYRVSIPLAPVLSRLVWYHRSNGQEEDD